MLKNSPKFLATINQYITWLREKRVFSGFRIGYKVIWNLFLIGIVILLFGTLFAGGVAAGYFASLVKDQPIPDYETMKKDITNYSETSDIYFANNKYLGKIRSDLVRTEVDLKDISPYLKNAVIATEDQYFYEHHGVVPKAVFRATFQELTNQSTVTGGSTLTQQLVKNQILTTEVSFDRKAKEILLAMRLENFFSKDDILKAYLNVVPFGRNAQGQNIAGVEAAARGIFDVEPKDINIAQAAFIAGLPKNPFVYTPFTNGGGVKDDLSAGINRAKIVLSRMKTAGYITQKEYDTALKYDYKKHFAKRKNGALENYPYLTNEVQRRAVEIIAKQLADEKGYDGEQLAKDANEYSLLKYESDNSQGLYGRRTIIPIEKIAELKNKDLKKIKKNSDLFKEFLDNANIQMRRNGYHIYTTINKPIYDKMQEVKDNYKNYEGTKTITYKDSKGKTHSYKSPEQVGAVMIKNDTGAILSFVGGRDFSTSEVNYATQTTRSNGSTMKPILDYGPAMEMGIVQPGTIVADTPFKLGKWTPNNYGGGFHGFETARVALARSHNIPAIRTYLRTNPSTKKASTFLLNNGITSLVGTDETNAASAIGAIGKGISVEEDTNAFATFANGGKFVDAYMIEKITDKKGNVTYQHKAKPQKVFTSQTSYLVLDMLRDVIGPIGTASSLRYYLDYSTDWAGKTGTSADWNDSWFVATNPNVTLGVWNGYAQNISLNHSTYHTVTLQLFAGFANAAHKIDPDLMDPKKRFNMPSGIVKRTFCGLSDKQLTDACKQAGFAVTDYFNTKYLPKDPDDSFIKARYVQINKNRYTALPSTPQEFTKSGVMLKEEAIKKYIPGFNEKSTSLDSYLAKKGDAFLGKEYKPDNKAPDSVHASLSGHKLSWSRSGSKDVVGYRIYKASNGSNDYKEMGHVINGDSLSYNLPNGPAAYLVKSVDITGKESGASNRVTVGDWSPQPPKEKPKDSKPTNENSNGDKNKSSSNNNNNGNNKDTKNNQNNQSDTNTKDSQSNKDQTINSNN